MVQTKQPYDPRADEEHAPHSLGDKEKRAVGDSSDPRGAYDPQKSPKMDDSDPRGELNAAEKSASSGFYNSGEDDVSANSVDSGFFKSGFGSSKSKRRINITKRRAIIGGALVGLGGGGFIGMFSIIQGPMEFVHLAENLQKFHFASNYDASDSRTMRMARYIYYRSNDQVYKTNLGYFQNKYADKVSEKLKSAGIESEYNSRYGYKERTRITSKFFGENQTPEQLKAELEKKYPRLDVQIDGKDVVVNHKETGPLNYRANTSFEKRALGLAGYSKVMSTINGRVMSARAGYVLHPFNKLDRKSLEQFDKLYAKWKATREKTISTGESITVTGENKAKDDPNTENKDESQTGEQTKTEGEAGIKEFTQTKTFRATAGVGAITGVGCMLKSLDDGYGDIKQKQVIEPAIRIGVDALSVASQIQSGDDFDVKQLKMMHEQLHGTDSSGKKTSFTDAMSLQAEEGKSDKGVPPSEVLTTIGQGSPFAFINSGALGSVFDAACSTGGQIVTGVIGFLGGPVSAAAGVAFHEAFGAPLQKIALDIISGDALNPLPVGADYGNTVNYGSRLAANSQMSSNGGQTLSQDQETELATMVRQEDKQDFDSKNLLARTFDIKDGRSLAAKVIDNVDPSPADNVASTASSLYKLPSKLFTNFSSFIPSVKAQDKAPYDYGFAKVGFSAEELGSADVDNPYKNAEDVVGVILPARPDFIERAKTCFAVDIDTTTYVVTPATDSSPSFDVTNSDECKDKSLEWMKTRFFIFDSNISLSASCYEGDEASCAKIGFKQTSTDSSVSSGGSTGCTNPFPDGWEPNRLDMGYDGTFKNKIVAPCSGTIAYATDSEPGWAGGGYMILTLDQKPSELATTTLFFAEGIKPTVANGDKVNAGDPIADPISNPYNGIVGNIEWGLSADTSSGYTTTHVYGRCGEAEAKESVLTFAKWAQSLGVGPPSETTMAGCP